MWIATSFVQPESIQFFGSPFATTFFSLAGGPWLVLTWLIHVALVPYAYLRLGFRTKNALLLLAISLIGSLINIPIAEFPDHYVASQREFVHFGTYYFAPIITDLPGTVLAINVGGAIVPVLISLYLLGKDRLWCASLLTTACVAIVSYWLAYPIPEVGIALPLIIPVIVTAVTAMLVSRKYAAPLAYISGSLGTLLGADLLNLGTLQTSAAPSASIGGAGTFDGVFLTGLLALLIADLSRRRQKNPDHDRH